MQPVIEVLFWTAVAALVYGYVGYPLLVGIAGRLRSRAVRHAQVTPSITVIIAAHNEQAVIRERLENALAVDYPVGKLEIVVASDGSTDATASIVREYATRGVRLLDLPRHGKIPALNAAVVHASGEILVFSDANIHFHPQVLRMLARNFADPEVGGVAGNCSYKLPAEGESSSRGEGLYWRYDLWLKRMESRTGSVVSAHGGLYALRRDLYRPPAEPFVTDDFAISTAVIEQGRRLVFDQDAIAHELAVAQAGREFRRKVRLMTRAWRSVAMMRSLLNPARFGFYSVVFFSHKVLRRLLPLALVVLFVCSMMLAGTGDVYRLAAIGQLAFYGLAVVGALTRRLQLGRLKVVYVPFYFCIANGAALIALGRFLSGQKIGIWEPQRQVAQPESA